MDGECCTYCNDCRKGHRTLLSAVDLFSKPFYSSLTLASERLQIPPNLAKLWHWHTPLGRVPTEHIHTTFHQQLSILVSGSWKLKSVFSGICYGPKNLRNINNIYLGFQVFGARRASGNRKVQPEKPLETWKLFAQIILIILDEYWPGLGHRDFIAQIWLHHQFAPNLHDQIKYISSELIKSDHPRARAWPGVLGCFRSVSEPLNVISNYIN